MNSTTGFCTKNSSFASPCSNNCKTCTVSGSINFCLVCMNNSLLIPVSGTCVNSCGYGQY